MDTDKLTNPNVRAAIETLPRGDPAAWSRLFEIGAEWYDDGSPRSLEEFRGAALGHDRFTAIDRIENQGLDLTGDFHTQAWGDFRSYLRFRLAAGGRMARLDIGPAE